MSKGPKLKEPPCQRAIGEQFGDRSGVRRTDHPKLRRLDLLADDELHSFRERFPAQAVAAFEQYDELEEQLLERASEIETAWQAHAEPGAARPILTTVVCMVCGASAPVVTARAWAVERAMQRGKMSEREVLTVVGLVAASFDGSGHTPPELDELGAEQLVTLSGLVSARAEPGAVRAALGFPNSEVRLTRAGMLAELERRRKSEEG